MPHHSVCHVDVHLVWATHLRRASIRETDDAALCHLLFDAARSVRCDLIACGNAPDHVHALVRLGSTIPVADIAQRLKGRSSFIGGWRWQRGYYAESVSAADIDSVASYIREQRRRHDDSHPMEQWVRARCESAEGGLEP